MDRKTRDIVIQTTVIIFGAPVLGLVLTIIVMATFNPESIFFLLFLIVFSLVVVIFYLLYFMLKIDSKRKILRSFQAKFSGVILLTFIALGLIHFHAPFVFGQTELYKPAWMCPKDAQLVISQLKISKVHSCEVREIFYSGRKVKEVSVIRGPASLCNLGCIYSESKAYIVDDEVVTRLPESLQ